MTQSIEPQVNWSQEKMIEVKLNEPDDFLKVRETLTRIGVASTKEKKLYQSCHILHKQGKDHIVALYYVCDSDGDTIIYNERKDLGVEAKSYTIKQKVTPKQGRMVIFDGTLFHTAEQPQNNMRCVVNYDLEPS